MFQNRLFFRSGVEIPGFGATISDAVARSSIVFCNSVSADRIVMAASRLLRAVAACVIPLSFAAGSRKSWSEKCEVWSVKCGVRSFKFGVRRVQCKVWSVECEDFASSLAEKIKRLSREGHGRDRLSLNYRSFMFGKLPPPACPDLC